jgi:hypothetical protein
MNTTYSTYTNDPDILELVAQYRAARAEADAAARRSLDNGIGDFDAAADMQAKQATLSTIETRLCVMFVGGLDRNKE